MIPAHADHVPVIPAHADHVPVIPEAFDLSDRVALVTGAGSPNGIGIATARLLGSLGARICVTATTQRVADRRAELAEAGIDALARVADLTAPDPVAVLVEEVVVQFGRLDIVVNNAGMVSVDSAPESGGLEGITWDAWHASLRRNLDSAFLVMQAALPHLRASGAGRIVNVASVTGPLMAMRGEVAYAAAKAGMVGLTRSAAVDLAASGITVNAVAPGWIATASQTEHEARQGARVPAGRSGSPEEVAAAIAWLCTPGAAYTTGQVLVVDGGNSVAEERD